MTGDCSLLLTSSLFVCTAWDSSALVPDSVFSFGQQEENKAKGVSSSPIRAPAQGIHSTAGHSLECCKHKAQALPKSPEGH